MVERKNQILKEQARILIFSSLLVLVIAAASHFFTPGPMRSYVTGETEMPADSRSVLGEVTLKAENGKLEGMRFIPGKEDPQLWIAFADGFADTVRTIQFLFVKAPEADTAYSVFYLKNGKFSAENEITGTISGDGDGFFVRLPVEAPNPPALLRLDIDTEYELKDIRISGDRPYGIYDLKEHRVPRLWPVLFLLVVFAAELVNFFHGEWKLLSKSAADSPGNQGTPLRHGQAGASAGLRYYLIVFLCCLPVLYMWASIVRQRPKLGLRVSCFIAYPALLAALILFALLFRRYVLSMPEERICWTRVYLAALFALAAAYMVVYLPMMVPDERAHYFSAYRIANLFLGKGTSLGEKRIILRAEDYEILFAPHRNGKLRLQQDMLALLHPFNRSAEYVASDASFATNAVLCYLPSALGIVIARLCNFSGIGVFYMGRLANIVFCLAVTAYIMKKYAMKDAVLFSVMGMPMMLHLMASCSYDAATFCCAQLFVFQVLSLALNGSGGITTRELGTCALFGALLAPAKTVYCPLLLLVFLIPGERFGHKGAGRLAKRLLPVMAGVFSLWLTGAVIRWLSTATEVQRLLSQREGGHIVIWNGEEGYSLMQLLRDPVDFAFLCGRTLFRKADEFFFGMIGNRLGYDIEMPLVLCVVSFLVFLAAVCLCEKKQAGLRAGGKVFSLLLCVGCAGCVVLAMTLSWTPLTAETVQGVQGRYFLPLLPLLAFVIRDNRIRVQESFRRSMVFVTFLINIWMLAYAHGQIIFQRLP